MMLLLSTKQKLFVLLLSCWLCITSGRNAIAQSFRFSAGKISSQSGLNTQLVRAQITDGNGFLWIVTGYKVQRFDGRFTKDYFINSDNAPLFGIAADRQQRIWVTDRKKVYFLSPGSSAFKTYADTSLPAGNYIQLHTTEKGKVFMLCRNGLMELNESKALFEPVLVSKFFVGGSSYFPFISVKDYLYLNAGKAVYRYHTLSKKIDSVELPSVRKLVAISTDSLWAGTTELAGFFIDFGNKNVSAVTGSLFEQPVNNGSFFIAGGYQLEHDKILAYISNKGFFVYSRKAKRFYTAHISTEGGLAASAQQLTIPYSADIGRNGFMNTTDGLYYLKTSQERIESFQPAISSNQTISTDVRNFAELPAGTVWMATANGLVKWNRLTGAVKSYLPKEGAVNYLNFASVRGVAVNGMDLLVAQSEGGCWVFHPESETFEPLQFEAGARGDSLKQRMNNDFIAGIFKLKNGDFLVAGNKSVYRIDKTNYNVSLLPLSKENQPIYNRLIYEDNAGRFWFVTTKGITVTNHQFKLITVLKDPSLNAVYFSGLTALSDSVYWLAGEGVMELTLKNNRELTVKKVVTHLPRQLFYNLYKDANGFIWVSAETGIYRLHSKQKEYLHFTQVDNVLNQNYYTTHPLKASDGAVFLSGYNGVNYFYPERFNQKNEVINCVITGVYNQKNDTINPYESGHIFSYRNNSPEIDFIAPRVYGSEKVTYRYKLMDVDKDWVYSGTVSSVRFSDLQPGTYSFIAAASINGEDWFETKQAFSFVIQPPFWQRWWFRLLSLFVVAALIFSLMKYREKRIKKEELQKTELEKLRAVNLQYELEIEQVTNFFATSISSQHTVDELLWDVAKKCISKLGFEDCVIYLKDDSRNVLIQKAAWGPKTTDENKIINAIEIPVGKGIVGSVALTGKAELVNDTAADDRYIKDDAIRYSEIAVPMLSNGMVTGVIDSEHSQKNFYTQRHLQILTTIASLCADKMEKIKAETQTREKEIEVLRLNKDLATSQLTALRSQMNPHFLFNAMNSIQQFTLTGDTENANLYISKFSTLLRRVLNSSKQNFITLQDEVEQLRLYLDIEQLRMGKDFTYNVIVDDEIEADGCKIPGMLIQPFAENSLKHGLSLKQGEKKLTIEFTLHSDTEILVTVTDNGIGRAKAAAIKEEQIKFLPHESKGIELIKDRLQLLTLAGKSDLLHIEDLTDAEGNPMGTRVQLLLPVFVSST